MKEYHLTIQEKENYCICSVLQAIFKKYRINLSQDKIAGKLTPAEKGFFVDDQRIKSFLNNKGFDYQYYYYNQTPFNEPDMLLADMDKHDGFIGINNHVYLLKEFIDPKILLIDPLTIKDIPREFNEFMSEIRIKGGFFGLVRKLK